MYLNEWAGCKAKGSLELLLLPGGYMTECDRFQDNTFHFSPVIELKNTRGGACTHISPRAEVHSLLYKKTKTEALICSLLKLT